MKPKALEGTIIIKYLIKFMSILSLKMFEVDYKKSNMEYIIRDGGNIYHPMINFRDRYIMF